MQPDSIRKYATSPILFEPTCTYLDSVKASGNRAVLCCQRTAGTISKNGLWTSPPIYCVRYEMQRVVFCGRERIFSKFCSVGHFSQWWARSTNHRGTEDRRESCVISHTTVRQQVFKYIPISIKSIAIKFSLCTGIGLSRWSTDYHLGV